MDRTTKQGQADNKAHATKAADADSWITVKDLQSILNIGHTKAYEILRMEGGVPFIKIGRSIRVSRRELSQWLERQRYGGLND